MAQFDPVWRLGKRKDGGGLTHRPSMPREDLRGDADRATQRCGIGLSLFTRPLPACGTVNTAHLTLRFGPTRLRADVYWARTGAPSVSLVLADELAPHDPLVRDSLVVALPGRHPAPSSSARWVGLPSMPATSAPPRTGCSSRAARGQLSRRCGPRREMAGHSQAAPRPSQIQPRVPNAFRPRRRGSGDRGPPAGWARRRPPLRRAAPGGGSRRGDPPMNYDPKSSTRSSRIAPS